MTDPVTLTAGAIATLAFQEFIKAGAGEAATRQGDAGDAEALAVWTRYGRWLGIGLSSLLYVLTPELVLIGGGLSAASDHFLPAVWREVEERVLLL